MASCTQIEGMLQAYIDGELRPSERVIVEQHLAECKACSALLRKHQRTSALLFEVFSEHRLSRDLRQGVVEHLPEMEPLRIDVSGVNWREESPTGRRSLAWQVIPALAACVLVVLAGILYVSWPRYDDSAAVGVGMVTHSQGSTKFSVSGSVGGALAFVKDIVKCGARYETGPDSKLMITLRGPTSLKMDENTRVRVYDDRKVNIEHGHVLLSVRRDEQRPFRVNTPTSEITVVGTVFDIRVDEKGTTVTVHNGRVQVENEVASSELKPGEQVSFATSKEQLSPQAVNVATLTHWAEDIQADQEAYELFLKEIQPRTVAELTAEQAFVIIANHGGRPKSISSFSLAWDPDPFSSGYCGYDVHVYNDQMMELFSHHIDAGVFADKQKCSYDIEVPGEPIHDANVLHIKVVPDFHPGRLETSFTKVSALSI